MPVKNGQGFSPEWTPIKQRFFRRFIRLHLRIAASAMKKWDRHRYYYFDLNAGCGVNPDTHEDGSPLIFVQEADKNGLEYSGYMIEVEEQSHKTLAANLDAIGAYRAAAIHADHNEYLSDYCLRRYRNNFGLFYADPTGLTDMPFELLARLSQCWTKADILMMLQAATIKRCSVVHDQPRLLEYLDAIRKKNWLVKKPEAKHQFTFVYGTNGPEPVWRREGFYSIHSPEGQEILRQLNNTNEENRNGTDALPLVF
jgi:three-Cys-motif partner protein